VKPGIRKKLDKEDKCIAKENERLTERKRQIMSILGEPIVRKVKLDSLQFIIRGMMSRFLCWTVLSLS